MSFKIVFFVVNYICLSYNYTREVTDLKSQWYQEFTSNTRIIILNMAWYREYWPSVSIISRVTLVLDIRNCVEMKDKPTVSMISSVYQLHSYDTALYQTYKYQTQFNCWKTNLRSRWYQVCTSSTLASPPSSSRCNRGASAGSRRT